jgi:hypothetical protein
MSILPSKVPDQPADGQRNAGQEKDGGSPGAGKDANDGDKGAEDLGEDEGPPE